MPQHRELDDACCICWSLEEFGMDQAILGTADEGWHQYLPHRQTQGFRTDKID
ncbi:hypothetical protein L9F63_010294, partial [Diploptera punctata]